MELNEDDDGNCKNFVFLLLSPLAEVIVGLHLWFLQKYGDRGTGLLFFPVIPVLAYVFILVRAALEGLSEELIGFIIFLALSSSLVVLVSFYGLLHIIYLERHKLPSLNGYKKKFNEHGVKVSVLLDFIDLCGGREVLAGLTTTQVNEIFLQPMTSALNDSYCRLLLESGDPRVAQANIFISHAWKYPFLHVVDAIFRHCNPEDIIWFDLFSNSQHNSDSDTPPFPWWCHTFLNAIKNIGCTVMIVEPWENPITLTRAWCLWEIFCTSITKSKFEIAICGDEESRFLDMISNDKDLFNDMISRIDVRQSESHFVEDKDKIFQVIKDTVGFNKLNTMVVICIRNWYISALRKRIESQRSAMQAERLLLMLRAVAYMNRDSSMFHEAEVCCLECLQIAQNLFPDSCHHYLLEVMRMTGEIQICMLKTAEGIRYLRGCLDLFSLWGNNLAGEDATKSRNEVFKSKYSLGLSLVKQGDSAAGMILITEFEEELVSSVGANSVAYLNFLIAKNVIIMRQLQISRTSSSNHELELMSSSNHELLSGTSSWSCLSCTYLNESTG